VVILFFVFYFMAIRPQSKKAKEHATMLKAMKAGDKVITSGGVVGTVVSVKEKTISIRSAETKLEILKSAISEITERSGETASSES
jgi:preprotein translocase subunit YajC